MKALNEKLAKAGFPFKLGALRMVPNPTLSDLIEACGESFEALVREHYPKDNVYYKAYMTDAAFDKMDNDCVKDCCGYDVGNTPEEAVACLWLTLHEK